VTQFGQVDSAALAPTSQTNFPMEVGLKFYKTKWGICRKLCAKNELTFSFPFQLATQFDLDD
jgi:hypothetical protein